ncbi:glycoside hydrolase family 73 protein [Streptococcus orisasini]|uniref:glycoside hydrolase family 73 protein n=1 Tax=Streptococcus orisasini TaxID=1080071 RepID=UPI000710FA0D|nr:glycoside hydrolase family 73 protein [Streptococcus orisasini]
MRARLKFKSFVVIVTLLFLAVFLPILSGGGLASAQKETASPYSQREFIREIAPTAQKLSKTYGVRSSIIIGQAVLDSNFGQTLLASKYHNLFSIKAKAGEGGVRLKSREYKNGRWHEVTNRYLVYKSWEDSLYDYMAILRQNKVWDKALYTTMTTSSGYKTVAKALQAAGFNSDPNYANKLIATIEKNNLTDYDK